MRTTDSNCLLCDIEKATKQNSHIVPKFMGKTILGTAGAKRGYIISASEPTRRKITQDTEKEDFILCPSCENYFSVLETYNARELHNKLWDSNFANEFTTQTNLLTFKEAMNVDPVIFRLFIYSIIWRCSVSNEEVFTEFQLNGNEEEDMRQVLFQYKANTFQDLQNIISGQPLIYLPTFALITHETISNRTKNVLFANPNRKNPYQFIFNDYVIVLSFDSNKEQRKLNGLNNSDLSRVKIGFLSERYWNDFIKKFFEFVADEATNSNT